MQIILTEEEYTTLKEKANDYDFTKKALSTLSTKFDELQSKYYKLLSHGVSINNEKLKNSSTKQEY